MAALIFVLTAFPRVPIPATGGYVHLGDAGIAFAACAFGPIVAMISGGLGTALADLLGFPQWAIFSLIVHGVQGWAMGMLLRRRLDGLAVGSAVVVGALCVVVGYFLAGIVLEGVAAALVEIVPNTIQAVSGGLIGVPLYLAVRRAYPPVGRYSERPA